MCTADLGMCTAELAVCNGDLTICDGDLTICEEDLAACEESQIELPGDGQGNGPGTLSYELCADGLTVADLITGLPWARNRATGGSAVCTADLHALVNNCTWTVATGSWINAVNAEGGKGFAGFSDWRVPNLKELESIVDFSIPFPGPVVRPELLPMRNTG